MALISCPDCHKQISHVAPACPHCGRPIDAPPIISPVRAVKAPKGGFICASCGETGFPKTVTPGSILIEILLWCALLLPGVIYSIWRLTARKKVCAVCTGHMIPITSPLGRQLLERANPNVSVQR